MLLPHSFILPSLLPLSLTTLLLHSNHLMSLPRGLVDLRRLTTLVLAFNRFIELPPLLKEVPSLSTLIMSGNNISYVTHKHTTEPQNISLLTKHTSPTFNSYYKTKPHHLPSISLFLCLHLLVPPFLLPPQIHSRGHISDREPSPLGLPPEPTEISPPFLNSGAPESISSQPARDRHTRAGHETPALRGRLELFRQQAEKSNALREPAAYTDSYK